MDDTSLDRLLTGDLNKLPSLPKRVVRLFISSTFTDMTLERNSLMERVYPRLKKYCRERHGLDFQVVDMRWGVRDEATDDHQTVNLCSREIDNCQRVSLGPNFVALIGDKYGFRPLLNRIRSTEYRSLRRCLIESDINTDFLDTWYKEDLNAVPAEYLLQPISSILKNFTNKNEPELQMVDQKIWQAIQERLHDLLLIGSERLVKQGRMSERERTLKYSISVTEREVLEGCLELNETKSHCLVYVRSIVDLREQLARYFEDLNNLSGPAINGDSDSGHHQHHQQLEAPGASPDGVGTGQKDGAGQGTGSASSNVQRRDSANRKASLKIGEDTISLTTSGAQTAAERRLERRRRLISKYIDLTSKSGGSWQIDEDAQTALRHLKEVKLRGKLGQTKRNLTIYEIHWNDQDGISAKSEEHKQYLNNLTEHFYQNLTRMIRAAVKNERKVKTKGLVGEVLQHSHYSLQVSKKVHGRSAELEQVRTYIQTGSCQSLLGSTSAGGASLGLLISHKQQAGPVLPMFLYGVSGSGKTSVLARVATLASDWIKQAARARRRSSSITTNQYGRPGQDERPTVDRWDRLPCIIMRFCCTTPASSSIVGMLTSVCRQLQYNFYQYGPLNGLLDQQQDPQTAVAASSGPVPTTASQQLLQQREKLSGQLTYQRIPEDFVRLVHTFRQLLNNCRHSLHKRRLFVIVIDSIERLQAPAECSVEAKYSWLTSLARLPPNVRLIVSCSSSPSGQHVGQAAAAGGSSPVASYEFLYLKAHFLHAYYKQREVNLQASSTQGPLDSSTDLGLLLEGEEESSSGSESSTLSSQLEGEKSSQSGGQRNSLTRYQFLRRLVLPMTRLARGSRSFAFDGEERELEQAREHSPSVVRFSPLGSTGGLEVIGGSGEQQKRTGSRKESLVSDHNSSCSDTLQSDHRSGGHSKASHTGAGLVHVRPLGAHVGQSVLRRWLAEVGRNLTAQQWSIVQKSLAHCSRPIFIKLAFGEVINWKSYSMQGDTKGLTFGSAWLNDFSLAEGGPVSSLCPELEDLCRNSNIATMGSNSADGTDSTLANDQEMARFKWQMLSMEQQWLNYLDYSSRKAEAAQAEAREQNQQPASGKKGEAPAADLVIRVGGNTGATSNVTQGGGPAEQKSVSLTLSANSTGGSGGGSGGGSSSSLSICHLSNTIEDAICQLFARIELQHGYLLTKHSLSYITAARNGICENELEDILSLDDVVLDDVFQYHLPPVRRIPPLLWTRIRNDLPDYLSERDADGIVITWHHDQFKSVTERRYLGEDSQLVYIHSLLADYFLGKWAEKPKPFRCTKQQVQMAAEQLESAIQQSMRRDSDQSRGSAGVARGRTSLTGGSGRLGSGSAAAGGRSGASFSVRNRLRSSDQHDQRLQWMQAKAHRRVPHQPLYYESTARSAGADHPQNSTSGSKDEKAAAGDQQQLAGSSGQTTNSSSSLVKRRYNLRKLIELPHHLTRAGRYLDLAREVLFNYRWLFAAIDALGLQSLFGDLDATRHALECELAQRRAQRLTSTTSGGGGGEHAEQEEDEDQFFADGAPAGGAIPGRVGIRADAAAAALEAELAVATRDKLTSAALRSLAQQLATLSDTLRLSSSVIHSQPQMLAPQLIGRLLPAVSEQMRRAKASGPGQNLRTTGGDFLFLGKLIEQCYKEGSSDCSLLPMSHCLRTADGLQLSSLEGHPFGVTAMALASDQRHLLAVSSKFIMWNISTGEVARDIEPKLAGAIIRGLVVCASNQFALAYSSDHHVLALEILTQQVVRLDLRRELIIIEDAQEERDEIMSLELIDRREARRFFVWTRSGQLVVMRLRDNFALANSSPGSQRGTPTAAEGEQQSEPEIAICVEYQIDQLVEYLPAMAEHNPNELRLLDVGVAELERDQCDLVFLTLAANGHSGGGPSVRFETLKVHLNSRGDVCRVEVWPSLASGSLESLALSRPTMRQLVTARANGDICLHRRRATRWSEPKVLLHAGGFSRDEHAPLAIECSEVQPASESSLENSSSSSLAFDDGDSGRELRRKLAEFETKIEGECEEIKNVTRGVFVANSRAEGENESRNHKRMAQRNLNQIQFVRLYWTNCIVVLRLDHSENRISYEKKCLTLPRDIRNVPLEPNRGQLMSIITRQQSTAASADQPLEGRPGHLLVVASNRKLLIYSIERELMLKCFEAHSSRITALLSISAGQQNSTTTTMTGDNDNGSSPSAGSSGSMQQFGNALASCSLDRTVNIWNLQNMDKEERMIDRLSSTRASSNLQFDSIQVNTQQACAACLSRGQLSLWNWPSSKLVLAFNSSDELPLKSGPVKAVEPNESSRKCPFNKCKFSTSGRYLALASLVPAIHLTICEAGPQQQANGSSPRLAGGSHHQDETTHFSLAQVAEARLMSHEVCVLSMDFFAQDSRMLVVAQCQAASSGRPTRDSVQSPNTSTGSQPGGSPTSPEATTNTTSSDDDEESQREPQLFDRLSIFCLNVPDLRRVYSIESLVPKSRRRIEEASERQFGDSGARGEGGRGYARKHKHQSQAKRFEELQRQMAKNANRKSRMASLTCDQQFLVVVEAKSDSLGGKTADRRLRRRSSAVNRLQLALNVYSARDGQFVKSIDLSQVQTMGQQQVAPGPATVLSPAQQQHAGGRLQVHPGAPHQKPQVRVQQHHQQAGTPQSSTISITSDQFNRLKSIRNRDRPTVVALIDDERGLSFLLDINTKLLLTYSSIWSGQLSSDGRYGLSRMFSSGSSSSSTAGGGYLLGGSGASSATGGRSSGARKSDAFASGGLKLLEMRHCRVLKSLLTLDQLNALNSTGGGGSDGSSSSSTTDRSVTTSHSDTICGFTKPNDTYAYFCDLRQRRLLLLRLRDSQLIANYKLSTPINQVKCSPDGLALILTQTDGSLVALAIVDPLATGGEAQTRLGGALAATSRRHFPG